MPYQLLLDVLDGGILELFWRLLERFILLHGRVICGRHWNGDLFLFNHGDWFLLVYVSVCVNVLCCREMRTVVAAGFACVFVVLVVGWQFGVLSFLLGCLWLLAE